MKNSIGAIPACATGLKKRKEWRRNDTAAENINQGKKHTVRIQNVDPFPIERQTIVDIINNHDAQNRLY